ncbi:MAG: hypothetical protein WDA42_02165 [Candidatus Bathyarchaeia archaeon]
MITLIVRPNNDGSRNKYVRLLQQLYPQLECVSQPTTTTGTPFIYGDNRKYWQFYQKHKIPYVLCENDIGSLRRGDATHPNERRMIEGAQKVLFPSEDFQKFAQTHYNCPPSLVIHLAHSKTDILFNPKPKIANSLVYCGGVLPWRSRTGNWGYRSYLKIFEQFIKYGWNVHLYAMRLTKANGNKEYEDIGCIIHTPVAQEELYAELSQYTIGFQGYNKVDVPDAAFNYTQLCRPNKLWEYLAAGIPTIGFQGGNGMQLYKNKWGIVLNTLDEIPTINKRIARLNLAYYRKQQVIENNLKALQQFLAN